jgi:hypothetical protein
MVPTCSGQVRQVRPGGLTVDPDPHWIESRTTEYLTYLTLVSFVSDSSLFICHQIQPEYFALANAIPAETMEDKFLDPKLIVWTEFQVAGEDPVTDQWNEYFQPIVQAPGHAGSSWARIQERSNTVLLVTCKPYPIT